MLTGRYEELEELRKRYSSNRFELGIVYGQRRIGKSSILDHFSSEVHGFMYQAKDADEVMNLESFSKGLNAFLRHDDHRKYSSFEDAFFDLSEEAKKPIE